MQGLTWTRVAATVPASTADSPTRTITLQEAVQWKAGDVIVLVSTVWKDEYFNQNEVGQCQRQTSDSLSTDVPCARIELHMFLQSGEGHQCTYLMHPPCPWPRLRC